MKNKALLITLISLLSVLALALIFLMVSLLNGKINFPKIVTFRKTSAQLEIDKTYDNLFDKIIIKTNASDIYIYSTDNKAVKVQIYSDNNSSSVNELDNALEIKSTVKACVGFCFNTKISKIILFIPKTYEGMISIENEYGDINIGEIPNASIEIVSDTGDIEVANAKYVNIENDYGDIKINEAEKIIVLEDTGDVNINKVNDVKVENDYGDIKITEVNKVMNVTNDTGDVIINNVNINENSFVKTDLGDVKIGITNEIYIDAKTDLGDVKINKNYRMSEVTLKIENDCGDIKVNN